MKNLKWFLLFFSIMKNTVASSHTFPVKLTCCIVFGPASSACSLAISVAINLKYSLE